MVLPKRLGRAPLALATLMFVAACGGADYPSPPRAQNDICAIFAERPEWRDAMEASERRWGAPLPLQMAIVWRESSFRADASPGTSSAFGYAQAIDGTWDWYQKSTGNSGADRSDFEDAADFVGWYMSQSRSQNGIGMWDAYNQYLAYHEGHAGHRRGSYKAKAWLQKAARQVTAQTARYRSQLDGC